MQQLREMALHLNSNFAQFLLVTFLTFLLACSLTFYNRLRSFLREKHYSKVRNNCIWGISGPAKDSLLAFTKISKLESKLCDESRWLMFCQTEKENIFQMALFKATWHRYTSATVNSRQLLTILNLCNKIFKNLNNCVYYYGDVYKIMLL